MTVALEAITSQLLPTGTVISASADGRLTAIAFLEFLKFLIHSMTEITVSTSIVVGSSGYTVSTFSHLWIHCIHELYTSFCFSFFHFFVASKTTIFYFLCRLTINTFHRRVM
jgi:hypothetical protein